MANTTCRSDKDAIALIEQLRSAGAKRVRVGDIEVEYATGPLPFLSPAPATPETDDQRRARETREQEERAATLFHSSG